MIDELKARLLAIEQALLIETDRHTPPARPWTDWVYRQRVAHKARRDTLAKLITAYEAEIDRLAKKPRN